MKKIIKISLLLLMAICVTGTVYAAFSCDISMKTEKSEYSKGDTITVDINISNIKSDRGVISFGGTLEYNTDSLTLEKMEGLNGWETPGIGTSYNTSNGKFIITRNGLGKSNETILRLKFKVKNESKRNLMITLKNITLADGTAPIKVNAVNRNITIKEGTENPIPTPGTDDSNVVNKNPSTSNNNSSNKDTTSKNDNTVSNKKIPQTGESNFVIPVLIGITIVIAIAFLVKIKLINHKVK